MNGRHNNAAPGAVKATLTPREREVLDLLATGMPQTKIADLLSIQPGTVKVHVEHIRDKTGATSARHLALAAARGEI